MPQKDFDVVLHLATVTPPSPRGFPPPVRHALIGAAYLEMHEDLADWRLRSVFTPSVIKDWTVFVKIRELAQKARLVCFSGHSFVIPVLLTTALRNYKTFKVEEVEVLDLGDEVQNGRYGSMANYAELLGLPERRVVVTNGAYEDGEKQIILDSLMIDVHLMAMLYIASRCVKGEFGAKRARTLEKNLHALYRKKFKKRKKGVIVDYLRALEEGT